jgi:hypothetical protein
MICVNDCTVLHVKAARLHAWRIRRYVHREDEITDAQVCIGLREAQKKSSGSFQGYVYVDRLDIQRTDGKVIRRGRTFRVQEAVVIY